MSVLPDLTVEPLPVDGLSVAAAGSLGPPTAAARSHRVAGQMEAVQVAELPCRRAWVHDWDEASEEPREVTFVDIDTFWTIF